MTPSTPILRFSGGTLLLDGLTDEQAGKLRGAGAWTRDGRVSGWRCDAVEYASAVYRLRAAGISIRDEVPRWGPVAWPAVNLPRLREDQDYARAAWKAAGRGVIVMPTGTGKTEVALAILRETAVSALVVAPVRDLMYQWHRRILQGLGYDAGIVGDAQHDPRPVTVTTYDSACIHMDRLGAHFGLVVFDECHHLPAPVVGDAARMCAAPFRLGLTATPPGPDDPLGRAAELRRLIGSTVYRAKIPDARRERTVADYDVVRVPVRLTPPEQARYDALSREVRTYMAKRRLDDPKITWEAILAETGKDPATRRVQRAFHALRAIEDRAAEKLRALEDLFRLHASDRVLVFAGSNAMAREVSLRFLIPCLLHHAKKEERREILDGFRDGTYRAIVANQVLDEGVDLPEAKVAVVLGGRSSARQAEQRLGRILRKRGDARATLYEVVCESTSEAARSRRRRRSEAYEGTRRMRI